MDDMLIQLEATVSAAGMCLVYNAEDWQLLSDANISPPHPADTEAPRHFH